MKLTCLEGITSKGLKEANEDSFYCDSKIAIVVDGASSLDESKKGASARWLVDRFVKYVVSFCDDNIDLKELVKKAINQIIDCYKREFGEPEEDRSFWPSASASILSVREGYLEYIVLGDSPVIFYPKNGKPTVVRDPILVQLDEEVVRIIYQYVLNGMELSQARKKVLPILKEHRRMICTSMGYAVISLDTACVEKALYGKI